MGNAIRLGRKNAKKGLCASAPLRETSKKPIIRWYIEKLYPKLLFVRAFL